TCRSQIARCPCNPYRRKTMPLLLQLGQRAVVIALAITHPVALARIPQGWNQNDIGRRGDWAHRLLYTVAAFPHLSTRRPQPELQRSVWSSDDGQRYLVSFFFGPLLQQRLQEGFITNRPERCNILRRPFAGIA